MNEILEQAQNNLDSQGFGGAHGIYLCVSDDGYLGVYDDFDGGEYRMEALKVLERIQAQTYEEIWEAIAKYAL